MFTAEDLDRVAEIIVEFGGGEKDSREWLAAREIDVAVIETVIASGIRGFAFKAGQDGDVEGALCDVIGQSFRLGWESALSRELPNV